MDAESGRTLRLSVGDRVLVSGGLYLGIVVRTHETKNGTRRVRVAWQHPSEPGFDQIGWLDADDVERKPKPKRQGD